MLWVREGGVENRPSARDRGELSAHTMDELADYKVLCFGGEPRLIEVHHGRGANHTQDFYSASWEHLDINQPGMSRTEVAESAPHCLGEMLEKSAVLSSGMCHVRVDWFICGGRLLSGEMTFFDGGGFVPFERFEDDSMIGSWIDLSLAYDCVRGKAAGCSPRGWRA